jgi:hypothetical protein
VGGETKPTAPPSPSPLPASDGLFFGSLGALNLFSNFKWVRYPTCLSEAGGGRRENRCGLKKKNKKKKEEEEER